MFLQSGKVNTLKYVVIFGLLYFENMFYNILFLLEKEEFLYKIQNVFV